MTKLHMQNIKCFFFYIGVLFLTYDRIVQSYSLQLHDCAHVSGPVAGLLFNQDLLLTDSAARLSTGALDLF